MTCSKRQGSSCSGGGEGELAVDGTEAMNELTATPRRCSRPAAERVPIASKALQLDVISSQSVWWHASEAGQPSVTLSKRGSSSCSRGGEGELAVDGAEAMNELMATPRGCSRPAALRMPIASTALPPAASPPSSV